MVEKEADLVVDEFYSIGLLPLSLGIAEMIHGWIEIHSQKFIVAAVLNFLQLPILEKLCSSEN